VGSMEFELYRSILELAAGYDAWGTSVKDVVDYCYPVEI
jgi:hypothetical protein